MCPAANFWREREFAPAPGTGVCALDDVPDGKAREFVWGEGREPFRLLILRSGESVWGYLNKCPHFGTPLNASTWRAGVNGPAGRSADG